MKAEIKRIIPSSVLLRGVRWFDTDVSGLPIGPIFKGQAGQGLPDPSRIHFDRGGCLRLHEAETRYDYFIR